MMLTVTKQIELFEGFTFDAFLNKARRPDGRPMTRQDFNVMFGGYAFMLAGASNGEATRSAWVAFVNLSRHGPK